jgi:hypothetical protein
VAAVSEDPEQSLQDAISRLVSARSTSMPSSAPRVIAAQDTNHNSQAPPIERSRIARLLLPAGSAEQRPIALSGAQTAREPTSSRRWWVEESSAPPSARTPAVSEWAELVRGQADPAEPLVRQRPSPRAHALAHAAARVAGGEGARRCAAAAAVGGAMPRRHRRE